MKYLILLGDGMADEPIAALGDKSPLEYACTPNMDMIAGQGTLGLINTIPQGFPPGSDVANLAVLGYDPGICYTGRGPLEAASMGINLEPGDVAFRCNLVTLEGSDDTIMGDFTAGHISSMEALQIIEDLNHEFGTGWFRFYPGVGYRHLLVWKGGGSEITATPPHDITGKSVGPYFPSGQGAEHITRLIQLSRNFLLEHPVNLQRRARGLKAATSIWPWGQGKAPHIKKIKELYKLRSGVISAVDLLNGIGIYAGMEILHVEGATGYTDTNYIGKAEKALDAFSRLDLVFLHVEAPDEMGHEGNVKGKIKAIEDFDEHVVGTVLRGLPHYGEFRVAVLSDHPTPIRLKTHTSDPSPLAVFSSRADENQALGISFGERNAKRTGNVITPGNQFLKNFIENWRLFVKQNTR
jgi:2,3-bisphosphoglycerate-independent phosphoglycerate mutase